VDCRLVFLGSRLPQITRAYREAVSILSGVGDPRRLLEKLNTSEAVRQCYEIRQTGGKTSVTMRESMFRNVRPPDDLELQLRMSAGSRTLLRPMSSRRLNALGRLCPLLLGEYGEDEVRARIAGSVSPEDVSWTMDLLVLLKDHGVIEQRSRPSRRLARSGVRPRITFLGHTSLLVESRQTAVLIDPFLTPDWGLPRSAWDVRRMRLGAICCTHSHWDHCNVQTLLWFDKDIPIIIPRVGRPSAFNPPIALMLEALGFTKILEAEDWQPIAIGDMEFVPLPFFGEQDEADAEIDHFTYVAKAGGLTVYGGVDCFRDTFGDMRPVLRRIGQMFRPDIAFLPVSKQMYWYKDGGVNGFCRYVDQDLLKESFQYTADPSDAAEWVSILRPKWAIPYATFTFSRWSPPVKSFQFWRSLRRLSLGRCFYPLRPADALDVSDLLDTPSSRIRRRKTLVWFGILGSVQVIRRRLSRRFRALRRAVRRVFVC
jgi:L-ascorbate metabolism protein UlaG (beta-lactamase superfamily)